MNRRWMTIIAGICSIVGGIFGIAAGAGAAYWITALRLITGFDALTGLGAALIALGIIAIIGGIMTLKRKVWPFALVGAICALFPAVPLGVLAIIFVAKSKREFK
jgi:membrane protease YdiL (CAAX protease family)